MYQMKEKEVTAKALTRLKYAKQAIEHTKQVFVYGAGNQAKALRTTNLNSAYRLHVQRNDKYWTMTPEARKLASKDPVAYSAAKAYITSGGNCGEHTSVAYSYLRALGMGEIINHSSKKGLDHAFVIIGDTRSEAGSELAVSDPWPTQATATIWRDHFAYTSRKNVEVAMRGVSDGKDKVAAISAGLTLTQKGKDVLTMKGTSEATEKHINRPNGHIWNHPDAAAKGKKYDYFSKDKQGVKDSL